MIEIAERAHQEHVLPVLPGPAREVLFDRGTVSGLLAEGIDAAAPAAGLLDAVADALDALGRTFFTVAAASSAEGARPC